MATKKFICKICGYVHEGDSAPVACPVCKAPQSEFEEQKDSELSSGEVKKFVCKICGYVHKGDSAPVSCPVCKAPQSEFEEQKTEPVISEEQKSVPENPVVEKQAKPSSENKKSGTRKFRCKVCGYIHEGDSAPSICPVCKAPQSEFEEIGGTKKKMDTNSNVYTIVYAAVMVIVVAFLLAFVNSSLREKQDENVRMDTKKQILAALHVNDVQNVSEEYAKYVKADMLMGEEGKLEKEIPDSEFATSYEKEVKEHSRLHVFVCEVEGETKYVIPVYGTGLWGAIWGYVALNADKDSVYGVYFSHASETPGLGAEIATEPFMNKFVGKKVLEQSNIALGVVKNGKVEKADYQVDGISGGTITSEGVNAMLKNCLGNYVQFLTAK